MKFKYHLKIALITLILTNQIPINGFYYTLKIGENISQTSEETKLDNKIDILLKNAKSFQEKGYLNKSRDEIFKAFKIIKSEEKWGSSPQVIEALGNLYKGQITFENYKEKNNEIYIFIEKIFGKETFYTISVYIMIADIFFNTNNAVIASNDLLNKVIEYKLKYPKHKGLFRNLSIDYLRLALTYRGLGLYKDSLKYFRKALSNYEKIDKDNTKNYAYYLSQLGQAYTLVGEYEKASDYLEDGLNLKIKELGRGNPELKGYYKRFADNYYREGNLSDAEILYQEALKESKKKNGENHIVNAYYYEQLAFIYGLFGLSDKEEINILLANSIRKILQPDDENIAYNNITLANLYRKKGNYQDAEDILLKGLSILKNLKNQQQYLASTYDSLGKIYYDKGLFQEAIKYIIESQKNLNEVYGKNSLSYASKYLALALAYEGLGNFKKSEELLLKNLEINKKIRGEKDPFVIDLNCSLALFYLNIDEIDKATNLMQKTIEIINEDIYNTPSKTIDIVSRTFAIILSSGGAYKEAIQFYKDNIASQKKYGYEENTLTISSDFEGLGKAYKFSNQYYKSIENYKKALKIKEKILGTVHLDLTNSLVNLGEIYAQESKYNESAKNYERAIKILIKILNREVQYVPEGKRISFVEKVNKKFPRKIFVDAFNSDENLKIALLLRLNLQGLIEEIDRKQLKLSNLSIQNKDLYKKIKRINNKLSKLNIDIKERNNLINEKEILEKELFKNIPEIKSRIFEIEEVAGSLKENSVLIEYQKYERNKKNYYLAFILKPNSDIEIINLKDAKEIEDKIKIAIKSSERLPEFKEQLNEAENNWKEVGNLIIKPLKEAIGNANTLFISPDSEINRVPFTALGSLKNKKFLSEDFKIRLLTTGRELIKLNNESNSNSYESLVVANPDFDSQLQSQKINNEIYLNNEYQTRSKDSRYKTWPQLPFTTLEGEFIAKKLNAKLLMNEKATVSAVQEVSAPNILHIASHSEYLEDIKIDNTSKNNELNNLNQKNLKENSLLRSYVVLAGANYPDFNPNDDGYLTAQEFSKLNFFGTELVVISGCESGQGDIKSGEGIYGLKRAIAISGARSSLLALWKVDDKATYEFMKTYYEQLSFGLGRVEALTETQKIFREKKDDILSSPYVWAAFQLSGDWKPIKFNYN